MGAMRILDQSGDTMVEWSINDAESIDRAKTIFDRQLAQKKLAYAEPPDGKADDAERVTRFDAEAREILWVHPIAGG